MTEALGDDTDGYAGFEQQRGVTVAQVVEPDRRRLRQPDEFVEPIGHIVGMEGLSGLIGEHVAGVGGGLAPRTDLRGRSSG
jgi:hypothetical protein